MAKPARATQAKRNRELSKLERRTEKEERRAKKKEDEKNAGPRGADDEDPDLVGIYPGPHNTIAIE